jgi:hypothetical protein
MSDMGLYAYSRLFQGSQAGNLTGSVTKIFARHTIKTGGEYRRMLLDFTQQSYPSGIFMPDGTYTQQTLYQGGGGNVFADYLTGLGGVQIDRPPAPAVAGNYIAGFAQDDWKVNDKLTLNIGVRYDLTTPRTERHNQLSWFDFNIPSPLQGKVPASACPACGNLMGGLVFVGSPGAKYGNAQAPIDWSNIAPRIGLAYRLDSKTVIRSAGGIIYGQSGMSPAATGGAGMDGFGGMYYGTNSLNNKQTIVATLYNAFDPLGLHLPDPTKYGSGTDLGNGVGSVIDSSKTPYSVQWNLNVQRQLPYNITLEVGYLGLRGIRLADNAPGESYTQLPASFMSLGAKLDQQVPNPFYGLYSNGAGLFSSPTIRYADLIRPYPDYGSVTSSRMPFGHSLYNAMTIRLDKRFSNGFSVLASFTGGKSLDDVSTSNGFQDPGKNTPQDFYNRAANWSLSSWDVSKRLVTSFVYELPIGKGRRFLNNLPRGVNLLATGWQANGIVTMQSGLPIGISGAINRTGIGSGQWLNNTGVPYKVSWSSKDQEMTEYFNNSKTNPSFAQPAAYSFGNLGPVLPNLRTPGACNFDLSFFKNNYIGGEHKLNAQFRAELFNAFNHTQLNGPDTNIQDPTFGQILGSGPGRTIQMALRLVY